MDMSSTDLSLSAGSLSFSSDGSSSASGRCGDGVRSRSNARDHIRPQERGDSRHGNVPHSSERTSRQRARKCVHKAQKTRARAAAKAALLGDAISDELAKLAGQRDAMKEGGKKDTSPPVSNPPPPEEPDPFGEGPAELDDEATAFGPDLYYTFRGDLGDITWRDWLTGFVAFSLRYRLHYWCFSVVLLHCLLMTFYVERPLLKALQWSGYLAGLIVFGQIWPIGLVGWTTRLMNGVQAVLYALMYQEPVRHHYRGSNEPCPRHLVGPVLAHGDLRPDSSAVGQLRHGYPSIGTVYHTITVYGFEVYRKRMHPSLEMVVQLATPSTMRLSASHLSTWERMQQAMNGLQSVNWNRYSILRGTSVPIDSTLLAYAAWRHQVDENDRAPYPRTPPC